MCTHVIKMSLLYYVINITNVNNFPMDIDSTIDTTQTVDEHRRASAANTPSSNCMTVPHLVYYINR